MRRRSGKKILGVVAVLAVAGLAAAGALRERPSPLETARPFVQLWNEGRFGEMRRLVHTPPADFVALHRSLSQELMSGNPEITLGPISERDNLARASLSARYKLRGLGDWTFRSRLTLRPGEDRWLVDWTPATIHPELTQGRRLARTRSWPARAPILASDGTVIVGGGKGVVVGMQPGRVQDRQAVASALEANLGFSPARVLELLERGAARPDQFVPVTEISEERYAQVRAAIYDIPGLVFQRKDLRLPADDAFAPQVVGRIGDITKQGLDELGEPYLSGDKVGQFGLEAALERKLAGRPSGEVRVVDGKGAPGKVLHMFPGEQPKPLHISLDVDIQRAAEAALSDVAKPSALVAIDAGSGEVRAVANRPVDGFNRAVAGRYPPGSTFKVITTSALLSSGVTVDQTVECPPQASAGGRTFRNFEGKSLGVIDFRKAFVESCNTAFVNLVRPLDTEKLVSAAESFGFGVPYSLGVNTAGGEFPPPSDTTERVAASIGQARVQASPLHMASVAAAVSGGTWRPPYLLKEGGGTPAPQSGPLEPAATGRLKELMRAVVANGTGMNARVPGTEVAGKTGTAEFGNQRPLRTHAWFIGFSGSLGFAVLVEDGGVGGEMAAPIAAKFLSVVESLKAQRPG